MSSRPAQGTDGPLAALARRQERARRRRLPWQTEERGPFDVVGDVHGCAETLRTLLGRLGYASGDGYAYRHPQGRRLLMLGDYVNREPAADVVLELVRRTMLEGAALALAGIRLLGLVPDRMRERRLHDRMRHMGLLGRMVAEARPRPVCDRVDTSHPSCRRCGSPAMTRPEALREGK